MRHAKGMTLEEAEQAVKDPLYYGNLMVREGRPTARSRVRQIRRHTPSPPRSDALACVPGLKTVSSFFLMVVPDKKFGANGAMIYADCGVVIDPDVNELAEIAIASADSCRPFCKSSRVSRCFRSRQKEARNISSSTRLSKRQRPSKCECPISRSTANCRPTPPWFRSVGDSKAPGSHVAGRANVLIFPDLNAGNIAYKLTERLTGGTAIGPILQGLDRPCNDLSRGCKAEDIVDAVAITAVQSQARKVTS